MAERNDKTRKRSDDATPADLQALVDAAQDDSRGRLDDDSVELLQPDVDDAADEADSEAIRNFVDDDDPDEDIDVSLKSILGGDILQSRFFQRQVLFILFCALLMIFYTGNRYASQQDIIVIDSLKLQVEEERYRVLTQSSELLNLSRQSNIEQQLILNGDSALKPPMVHPYEIVVKPGE